MANLCDVSYKIVGDSKEVLQILNALRYLEKGKTPMSKSSVSKIRLGHLVSELGGDCRTVECRGDIVYYQLQGGVLTINQETDWSEQTEFRHFLQKSFPSLKIYYQEEEPGLDVYSTNDSEGAYFPYRYVLDSNDGLKYFETIEDAAKCISAIVKQDVLPDYSSIVDVLDFYVKKSLNQNMFYYFHEFNYVEE